MAPSLTRQEWGLPSAFLRFLQYRWAMSIERFLKQSDGFEVDEPVDPVPVPPVVPGGTGRFGLTSNTTSSPLITGLPNVSGLSDLVRALAAREAALRSADETNAAQAATEAAEAALKRIGAFLSTGPTDQFPG
jgi:hypothetical protein